MTRNADITDKNFKQATTKLAPGRKFEVKVFQITTSVTSKDCLAFLRSQKAVLTGAQGASLAYEFAKNKLPVDRWAVSFDEKNALWEDSGGFRRVPFVYPHLNGCFEFFLGGFEAYWVVDYCLLCFRDC